MGDDWTCRCDSAFLSSGDRGDEARTGEDERGEDTAGRWFHGPEKMGVGAIDSISVAGGSFRVCNISLDVMSRVGVVVEMTM